MTADVTVWLTGEAEMSLNSVYEVGVDRNKDVRRVLSTPIIMWPWSLYYWHWNEYPDDMYDDQAERHGARTLADRKNEQRIAQWDINRDYKQSIDNRLDTMGNRGIGASVAVYKNGEYVKTVSLVGSGLPVSVTSSSVSGLPTDYWPPGTIRSIDNPAQIYNRPGNVAGVYDALAAITVRQSADISYQSSTPQALIDVNVDTGDMVHFVIKAGLGTSGMSAPPLVDLTHDRRLHINSTSVESTGYRDATVTIEGGSVDIFCCS